MNINTIKNYNQKLLAVLGTLAAILLAISISLLFYEFFGHRSYNYYNETEMITNEQAEENYDQNIRTQQISFEEISLVDSSSSIYIIPVTQSELEHEEYIKKRQNSSDGLVGLVSTGYSNYYRGGYRQSYNNVLVYYSKDNSIQKLFDHRLSINQIRTEKIADKSYIMLTVTYDNTNLDNVLDIRDNNILYIYSTDNRVLNKVNSDNLTYIDYEIINKTEQLIIKFGVDKNKNGSYDWNEPKLMKLYSIKDNELSELIDPELIEELQSTLDGKK